MAINQNQWTNSYVQQNGQINVAELFNYSGLASYNGQSLSYAQFIQKITNTQLVYNPYERAWLTKKLRTIETSMNGTKPYAFGPAAVPVSNYNPSDYGNRNFTTGFQVFGTPILFLQTNFWVNEFINTIAPDVFKNSLQDMLLNSYSKSIAIVKAQLSALEAVMFSLATGQFFFVDFLGDNVVNDPLNPNSLGNGMTKILWSTQAPVKIPQQTFLGNTQKSFIQQEIDMLSKFMMKFPLSIDDFAIGYDLDKIHIDCSYFMRSNLATAINLGWPTDTNMNVLKSKSYEGAYLSQWLNVTLTDTGTLPFFQNNVPLVQQAQAANNVPLGYGINNVSASFSYLKNVVGYISMEGSIEQYVTPYVPFNPYTDSKTYYRLGGVWGWGQVHLPIYARTNYALLDSKAYIKVTSNTQTTTTTADHDWTVSLAKINNIDNPTVNDYYTANTNPTYTAIKVLNGIEYTLSYVIMLDQLIDDMIQAQAILASWEPGMQYPMWYWGTDFATADLQDTSYNVGLTGTALQNTTPIKNWTFGQWLQARSLNGLATTFTNSVNNQTNTVMDVIKIGDYPFAFTNNNATYEYPADAPAVPNALANGQTPGGNNNLN